ncbi:unnamed protein product [Lactuca saligna]|uniref:Uncharacterized protein n=1 Tax=Lactuca saligna TaxID=75948 RepID=A0AA35ZVX3_LACSI|nr:unnamed protein product [Lactuca saligna]
MEEEKTSNINENLSNKDVHVNMGEGRTTIETSTIGTTTFNTTTIPPPTSPLASSMIIPISTCGVSPTFFKMMQEAITTLFSSQSTDVDQGVHEEENDDDLMVAFANMHFNLQEDDMHDIAIMSGKQFKMLNSKLNSILEFLNDSVGKTYVSGVEVEYLLKSQESSMYTLIEDVDKRIEKRLATHS